MDAPANDASGAGRPRESGPGTSLRPLSVTLRAGALYDFVFAVLSVAAPAAVTGPLGLPLPGERFYLWVQAALLAIAGACYASAARDPRAYRPIVGIAIVGRFAGFVLLGLATVGRPDLRGLWIVAFADLAFGVAHLVTGRRLWR